jgi:hypothetical protein
MISRYYFYSCKVTHPDSLGSKSIVDVFKHKSLFKNPIKAKELIKEKILDGYEEGHKAVVTELHLI